MTRPLLALLAGLLTVAWPHRAGAQGRPPNVVVILTDDAGFADWGPYTEYSAPGDGLDPFPTPHIDRLAAEGVRFTQAYVTAPLCAPSRAGLLTGRYPQRFGFEFNNSRPQPGVNPDSMGISLGERTLADALRQRGYRTAAVGKWHLGEAGHFHPLRRGFDEFFGHLGGWHDYFREARPNPVFRGYEPVTETPYLTEAFGREAVSFIERNRARPFFLYLAFNAPHAPMQAEAEDVAAFTGIEWVTRRRLAAMTRSLDREVGRVLNALDRLGLSENTLLFLINDNGGASIATSADNGILRGMKGALAEGGVRVPFFVRWPGRAPSGVTFGAPVSTLDVFATALAASGGPDGAGRALDGVDLAPFLDGRAVGAPHDRLYWRLGVEGAVRRGDWKLVRYAFRPPGLYDLAADPGERRDLSAERPDLVRELFAELFAWEATLEQPRWTSSPPGPGHPNRYDNDRIRTLARQEPLDD